jgi:hypothetical protein
MLAGVGACGNNIVRDWFVCQRCALVQFGYGERSGRAGILIKSPVKITVVVAECDCRAGIHSCNCADSFCLVRLVCQRDILEAVLVAIWVSCHQTTSVNAYLLHLKLRFQAENRPLREPEQRKMLTASKHHRLRCYQERPPQIRSQ